jgi:hypothetical protein
VQRTGGVLEQITIAEGVGITDPAQALTLVAQIIARIPNGEVP